MTESGASEPLILSYLDDSPILDLVYGRYALPTVQFALDIGLFELLAQSAARSEEVAQNLGISERAAEAILAVLSALGFLEVSGNSSSFTLLPIACTYLLRRSPLFRRRLLTANDPMMQRLSDAARPEARPVTPLSADELSIQPDELVSFFERMDGAARPTAAVLSRYELFLHAHHLLDVGGGSGAFVIAIGRANPQIRCTLLDREPVCKIAAAHVTASGLHDRIKTFSANMLKDAWPRGFDLILFASVFHNWDPQVCRQLAAKSFEVLEPGGQILIHEIPLNPRKNGPMSAACLSVAMLLNHSGKQYTLQEISDFLISTGFENPATENTCGPYYLVRAKKPR